MSHEKAQHLGGLDRTRLSRGMTSRTPRGPPKSLSFILSSQRRSAAQSDRYRVQNARPFADSKHIDQVVNVKHSHLSHQKERRNNSHQHVRTGSVADGRVPETKINASSHRSKLCSSSGLMSVKREEPPRKEFRRVAPLQKSRWHVPQERSRRDNSITRTPSIQPSPDGSSRKRKRDHCAISEARNEQSSLACSSMPAQLFISNNASEDSQLNSTEYMSRRNVCARSNSSGEEIISPKNLMNKFISNVVPHLPHTKPIFIKNGDSSAGKTWGPKTPKNVTDETRREQNGTHRSIGAHARSNDVSKDSHLNSTNHVSRGTLRAQSNLSGEESIQSIFFSGEESISQKNSVNSFVTDAAPDIVMNETHLQSVKEETLLRNKNSAIHVTTESRDRTVRSPEAMNSKKSDYRSPSNSSRIESVHQMIPNNISESSQISLDASPKNHTREKDLCIKPKDKQISKNNINDSKQPIMIEDEKSALQNSYEAMMKPESSKIQEHVSLLEREVTVLKDDISTARSKLDTTKNVMASASCNVQAMSPAPQSKLEDALPKKKRVFPFRFKKGCIVAVRFQKIVDSGNYKVVSVVKDGDVFRPTWPSLENTAELKSSDASGETIDSISQSENLNANGDKTSADMGDIAPVEERSFNTKKDSKTNIAESKPSDAPVKKNYAISQSESLNTNGEKTTADMGVIAPIEKSAFNTKKNSKIKNGCKPSAATKRKPSLFEVWSDPIGKDDGISLLGSWIKCAYPKSFIATYRQNSKHTNHTAKRSNTLEGNVISIRHTSQRRIIVGLLVDRAYIKSLPFLQVESYSSNDSLLSDNKQERRKLEAKIQGENKVVVVVSLASVFQKNALKRNASKPDRGVVTQWAIRKRVIAKPAGKKPSKRERKRNNQNPQSLFVGDGNDSKSQQENNWRWIASRTACQLVGTSTGHSCLRNDLRDSVSQFFGEVVKIDAHLHLPSVATVTVKRLLTPEQTTMGRLAHHRPLDLFDPEDDVNQSYFQAPIEQLIVIGKKLSIGRSVGDGWNFSVKQSLDSISIKSHQNSPIEPDTSNGSLNNLIRQAFSGMTDGCLPIICNQISHTDFKLPNDMAQLALRPSLLPIVGNMESKSYVRPKRRQRKKHRKRKKLKPEAIIKAEPSVVAEEERYKPSCCRTVEFDPKQKLCSDNTKQPFFRENALPRIIKIGKTEEKTTLSGRAARANQRRIFKKLTALGSASEKVDRLAGRDREQQLRFDKSRIHGWGVFAEESINACDMIIEYRGEIIGNAVADKRELEYQRRKLDDYMFRIDAFLGENFTTLSQFTFIVNCPIFVRCSIFH